MRTPEQIRQLAAGELIVYLDFPQGTDHPIRERLVPIDEIPEEVSRPATGRTGTQTSRLPVASPRGATVSHGAAVISRREARAMGIMP